ncbi:hypothetical protein L249_3213 [Ophiocordyceps polyrhachis-furcata BCC 54312]|uniref:alcohol dehydrogenase (NADP(+)) n=1 Tax=Ophiocordyceps polyrhachis-furcata BCC 54312 TaxID=1330021 RepID=A0A367LRW2_9HYPO|nr:hypothetical protein L249_3213 [Ophiocordyceps polyrhachis-furcata BCC 54312]
MAANDYKFEGWVGHDASSADGKMVWQEYEPKGWDETDIDIKITHSGVCGTDIHILRSSWKQSPYPVVVGHEIVGRAVRVGSQAKGNIQVGDLVGVGAQSDSCLGRKGHCDACSDSRENYCEGTVMTYGSKFINGDKSYGGYGLYHRCPSHFVIKIPDGLSPELAAPMLCAGVTVYSPLKQFGAGPGKRVAVVGVGGLGHFAVLFAKAMGVDEVVGISRRNAKREEAMTLGCDGYIATLDDEDWASKNTRRFDLIINTIDAKDMPMDSYLGLLKVDGSMVQVGIPDGPVSLRVNAIATCRRRLAGSFIGSPSEIREMFQLAADKKVKPWVETRSMKDANQTIVDMEAGKARFRYVMANEE